MRVERKSKRKSERERFVIQLDWIPSINTRKIILLANQKGYDNSETTVGKLLARRI